MSQSTGPPVSQTSAGPTASITQTTAATTRSLNSKDYADIMALLVTFGVPLTSRTALEQAHKEVNDFAQLKAMYSKLTKTHLRGVNLEKFHTRLGEIETPTPMPTLAKRTGSGDKKRAAMLKKDTTATQDTAQAAVDPRQPKKE